MIRKATNGIAVWLREFSRGWSGATALFFGLYVIGHLLYLVFRWGGEENVAIVSDGLMIPTSCAVVVVLWRASRSASLDERSRRGWRYHTLAYLCFAIGNILWLCFELESQAPPFPSAADPFFLGFYPLMMVALVSFSDPHASRADEAKFWTDAAVVMVAGAMFTWHFVLTPILHVTRQDTPTLVASVAFPVADLVLLFGIISLLLRGARQGSLPWFPLVSCLLFFGADTLLAYQTSLGTFQSGTLPDMLWAGGFYVALLSGQYQIRRATSPAATERVATARSARFGGLPHVAVALGCLLLLYDNRHAAEPIVYGGIALAGLVVYRQILAARLTSRAYVATRAAHERLELVSRASNDAVWDWSLADNRVWRSDGYTKLFGYPPDQVGQDSDWWTTRVHPEDTEHAKGSVTAAIAAGEDAWSGRYRFRRADGSYAHVFDRGFVLRDEAGTPVRILGAMMDVTERMTLEDRLRQAQKMEAVGQLAGGVAHDFNNLLMVIGGYSDILLAALEPDDPRRKFATQIRDAGDRAASLTRQLLAFSRRTVLEPKVLDLNEAVRNVESMLERLIGEDVGLVSALGPSTGRVKVDPGQLEQVLMNLAVNARDAMPTGGRLTIRTHQTELTEALCRDRLDARPGHYAVLSVADTGCGMSPEILARVFEPFFTTKTVGKGTGLGLSTVYGIVKQSDGHLAVSSEVGVGTTFEVYLPAAAAEAAAGGERALGSVHAGRGTETILLAEDEPGVRAIAKLTLEELGYTVLEASGGEAALALAEAMDRPADLLVTDVVMPGMSGRELASTLAERQPGLKVLYMSGYTDDAVMRHGILHAEVAFLQKPFTAAALAAKVRELLDPDPHGTARASKRVEVER